MDEQWIELSDTDVMPANSQERIGVSTAKGRDDLQDICDQVVQQVRDAYLSGGRPLGDDGTIPSGLKMRAIAIALWRFITEGVGKNEGVQTRSREDGFKDAVAYLQRIAERTIKGTGSAQIVSGQPRQATRKTLGGL